jgi:hypothetical protein
MSFFLIKASKITNYFLENSRSGEKIKSKGGILSKKYFFSDIFQHKKTPTIK